MTSPALLTSLDRCARREFLERSWERRLLPTTSALYQSIEAGLTSPSSDPARTAYDHFMTLAVDRGFDTDQSNLLAHAEHHAALVEMIVWLLRTGDAWERVPSTKINSHVWNSSAFTFGSHLRRILLVDRWDEDRLIAVSHSWEVAGECTVYGVPMDLIVIVIGPYRDGKRHGPLSKAFQHPIAKNIRFRKRDGESFESSWTKVFRESAKLSREEWFDVLAEDGVLEDIIITAQIDPPHEGGKIRELIQRRLNQVAITRVVPDPQFSNCDLPVSPCPFKSCCPYWREPSEELGFIRALRGSLQPIRT